MYGVLVIPNFFLQAQLRIQTELWKLPVVLLEEASKGNKDRGKARILQATKAALNAGVDLGMTATQGQARCGELQVLYRSSEDEKTAEAMLLDRIDLWTPDFEATAPGVCTLDLLGNGEARRSPERLGKKMVRPFAEHGLQAQVGFASHPGVALLAARQAAPVLVVGAVGMEEVAFLNQLPVQALMPSADLQEVLRLWGVSTLGQLRALPASELVERLGPEVMALIEGTQSRRRRLLKLVRPPSLFLQQMEFEHPVETLEPLLFVIRRMLETLAARLAAVHLMAGEIYLTLGFEDETTHERNFRVPDPSREVDLLFRILHTYLENFTAETPMVLLALEAMPSRALAHQFELFESSLRDPNRFSETLARLEALLGEDRVGTPEPLATHRPDAFVMKPFQEISRTDQSRRRSKKPTPLEAARQAAADTIRLGLPLRRFRPPERITVMTEKQGPTAILSGQVQGPVPQQRGPWLLSGEWWHDALWAFKEWDVQLEDGGVYRIAEVEKNQWILVGAYG